MKQLHHRFSVLLLLLTFILIIASCSKESILPHQIDTRDLDISFFRFAPTTVVLPVEKIAELEVLRTKEELILKKSEELDSIAVNSVIMTPLYTPYEDITFRRVDEIIDMGDQVRYITSPATLENAFLSYFYDTAKPEVISYRNSYAISDIINSPLATVAVAATEAMIAKITKDKINPDFGINIDGSVDFSMVHPHTHFAYYMQNEPLYTTLLIQIGGSEDTGPVEIMEELQDASDEDNDGTADIIETFYSSDPSDDESYPNIKKINLNDFRIVDLSMKIPVDLAESKFNIEEDLMKDTGFIKTKLEQFKLADELPEVSTDLPNFKYVPFPGVAFPLGGINLVFFSRAKLDIKLSADILLKLSTLENLDIEFGYLDWENRTAEADFIVKDQNGNLVESEALYDLFNADLQTIIKLEGTGEVGVGFGSAVVIGEPTLASGVALGGYLYPHLYLDATAQFAVSIDDVFADRANDRALLDNSYLSGCVDIGMAMDAYLFFDAEFVPDGLTILDDLNNLFDVQKKAYTVKRISFLSYLLGEPEAKLCFPRACAFGEIKRFDISEVNDGLQFGINVENFALGLYNIEIISEFGEIIHTIENLEYNLAYDLNLTDINKVSKIIQQRENLQYRIHDLTQDCKQQFFTVSYQLNCSNDTWNTSSNGVEYFGGYGTYKENELSENNFSFTHFTASGTEIGYFTKSDAQAVCSNIGGRLPFFNELSAIFGETNCFVPSGFIVPNTDLVEFLDSEDLRNINTNIVPFNILTNEVDRIVSWVADEGESNIFYYNVLDQTEVIENINPDEFSFYAPCICVR